MVTRWYCNFIRWITVLLDNLRYRSVQLSHWQFCCWFDRFALNFNQFCRENHRHGRPSLKSGHFKCFFFNWVFAGLFNLASFTPLREKNRPQAAVKLATMVAEAVRFFFYSGKRKSFYKENFTFSLFFSCGCHWEKWHPKHLAPGVSTDHETSSFCGNPPSLAFFFRLFTGLFTEFATPPSFSGRARGDSTTRPISMAALYRPSLRVYLVLPSSPLSISIAISVTEIQLETESSTAKET